MSKEMEIRLDDLYAPVSFSGGGSSSRSRVWQPDRGAKGDKLPLALTLVVACPTKREQFMRPLVRQFKTTAT